MLKTRIITALVLLIFFVPALFLLPNFYWAIAMLSLLLFALHEWANLIQLSFNARIIYLIIAATVGLAAVLLLERHGFHWFFFKALSLFACVAIFWILLVPFWFKSGYVIKNKTVMACLGLLLIASFWLALICAKGADPLLLLALMATIWIADSAAYFAGKKFGKNKLAPNISPGKTWEGVFGALIAVTIFGAVLYLFADVNSLAMFPALWAITSLGVVGDLFESMLKRQANLKDSGNILPGHGGILDRIDGLIPSLPIAILMIYSYNLYGYHL